MILRHLDLFSGIGGFALASHWAGFTTIGFAETDSFCSEVLKKHWPHIHNYGDVKNIKDFGKSNIDLITGGFPCQPFSQAGQRKGKKDERYLWPEFYRIITECEPHWVVAENVAENVAGIVDMELNAILDDLERAGYETQTFIIPASAVQAPHQRKRTWIIAHSLCKRCNHGFDLTQGEQLQIDWKRDVETLQKEWTGFFPQSWTTFDIKNWLGFTADADSIPSEQTDTSSIPLKNKKNPRLRSTGLIGENTTFNRGEESQPPIPGVDDGLPDLVDRNKALGNAIVPQVIYPILRLIALMRKYDA